MASEQVTEVRMTVRVRFGWWVTCVLKMASQVARIPGCRWLVRLLLLAAWMQIKMDGPKHLGTSWHWMRIHLEDQQRQPARAQGGGSDQR